MKPAEIESRLSALRAAGAKLRLRPAHETLSVLAQVMDGWSDGDSPWRRDLAQQLPAATGFSRANVEMGLQQALDGWTGAALLHRVESELGSLERLDTSGEQMITGFDTTAVLLAGSIPMPSLLEIIAPLVLRSPVLAKAASRDPVTPRLVADSIAHFDAELGECVDVVDFPGNDDACMQAFLSAECISATGSDETIASVRARMTSSRRLLVAGHRLSVAALGPEAIAGEALRRACEAIALDVALWDQLGCLSPIAIYVTSSDSERLEGVAAALAAALQAAESAWPRGEIDPAAAASVIRERAEAEMRAASGRAVRVFASEGTAWTVTLEDDIRPRPAPLHRFVRVIPVADEAALGAALSPFRSHLAAVALDGFGPTSGTLARTLADLGVSRICPLGSLQSPPLDWPHEGRDLIRPLARLAHVEWRRG
jgi:hypothetical protein